jgi:hypothetical protein
MTVRNGERLFGAVKTAPAVPLSMDDGRRFPVVEPVRSRSGVALS